MMSRISSGNCSCEVISGPRSRAEFHKPGGVRWSPGWELFRHQASHESIERKIRVFRGEEVSVALVIFLAFILRRTLGGSQMLFLR